MKGIKDQISNYGGSYIRRILNFNVSFLLLGNVTVIIKARFDSRTLGLHVH